MLHFVLPKYSNISYFCLSVDIIVLNNIYIWKMMLNMPVHYFTLNTLRCPVGVKY